MIIMINTLISIAVRGGGVLQCVYSSWSHLTNLNCTLYTYINHTLTCTHARTESHLYAPREKFAKILSSSFLTCCAQSITLFVRARRPAKVEPASSYTRTLCVRAHLTIL